MKKKTVILVLVLLLCVSLVSAGILLAQGDFETLSGWRQTAWAVMNRTKLHNTEFIGSVSTDTWSETDGYALENTAVLQKEAGRDFVVMNLTDLHLTDLDYFGGHNSRLFSHIRVLAEKAQPDLITVSGDLVCSASAALSVHQFTDFMDSLGIPWAPVFGNHDNDGNCDLNYLADVMSESSYCLLEKGDPALGVGNYIVNICQGDVIVHSLILMDSHEEGLWEDQIGWYRWAAEGAAAPSTVIMHIPIIQYEQAYSEAWGENGWKDGFDAFGEKKEEICEEPEGQDTGFFAAVQEIGLTKNILCGHDHINDFSLVYEGVRLSYSMRLGVYGAHDPENMGASVLTIGEDGGATLSHIHRYE